jgi:hypothetical protein
MSSKLRRFEILLPQRYNDGREIPRKLLGQALGEIVDSFGAASFEPSPIEGLWRFDDTIYSDSLSKIVIDVGDSEENREWMREFKARWKEKLEQVELWLVSYEIEVD